MIDSLQELICSLNERWLEQAQPDMDTIKVRAYLNGRYRIESIELSEEDDTIVLWLDERGAGNG